MTATKQLRYLVRKLIRSPLFTVASVVTLGLGIGANTAIFTVVNGVLLKALPYDQPERLVGMWHTAPGLGFDEVNQSPATYLTYREEGRVFEDIGMWRNTQVAVTGRGKPEKLAAMQVTDGILPILRVQPVVGRRFTKEDDLYGSPRTVMVSYGYWQRRFGGDRGVIGQTLRVDGEPYTIIGVLPADFRFLRFDPALYLPFQLNRAEVFLGNFSYQGLARLKPGATIAQANADVARMIPMTVEKFPRGLTLSMLKEARFGPNVRPLKVDVVGDVGKTLWILLGTVGLVLLIACANVANLFLVRAEGRQREVAIRTALGAGRGRIVREFLGESVALGMLGGVVGVGLAWIGVRFLVALAPQGLPRLPEIGLDPRVLLFAAVISVLAGLLFGLFPVLKYGRPNLVSSLKEGGRGNSAGRDRHRARNALVVAQIALALVLLVGSGLMIRSFQALRRVDPGFRDPGHVLTLTLDIPEAEVKDPVAAAELHHQIMNRIAQIPGVTAVGLSSSITMDQRNSGDPIFVEGFPVPEGQLPPIRRFKWISPEYFQTMGNQVVAGRGLTWADIDNQRPVVLVTESFAREYFHPPGAAIGKRIKQMPDQPWREIIGVVGNVHDEGVDKPASSVIYWPLLTYHYYDNPVFAYRDMSYAIRSARVGSAGFLDQVRQAIWAVNPNLPLANVRTLQAIEDRSMARTSFMLVMLAIAAAVALVLGTVGIYGVISYVVSQRTREIGVRMALGAQYRDVSGMVLRQGLLLTASGLVVGILAAAGLTRLMASLLFGVKAVDPLTYAAVAAVVAAVALLACYVPAHRATRVDPLRALHWE